MIRVQLTNRKSKTWTLRWRGATGKHYSEGIGPSKGPKRITKTEAQRLRDQKVFDLTSGKEPQDKLEKITLGTLLEIYPEKRRQQEESNRGHRKTVPKLAEDTINDHTMTIRYLIEYFGTNCQLVNITANSIEQWLEELESGRLAAARNIEYDRVTEMSTQTIKKHIRQAKAIYNWSKHCKYISLNPFDEYCGQPGSGKPKNYVSIKTFEKLLDKVDSLEWRVFYCLQRLAGLRRSEALELVWDGQAVDHNGKHYHVGIDWTRNRIQVLGRNKSMRKYREVPICPLLIGLLQDHRNASEDTTDRILSISNYNLARRFEKHAKAAEISTWNKPFQSLRTSCENDWKTGGVAEATYVVWMGHSATVSRNHYVEPTVAEFKAITNPESTMKIAG